MRTPEQLTQDMVTDVLNTLDDRLAHAKLTSAQQESICEQVMVRTMDRLMVIKEQS